MNGTDRAPDDPWAERIGTALARYDQCRLDGLAPHVAETSLVEFNATELDAFRALQATLENIRKVIAPYPDRPFGANGTARPDKQTAIPKSFGRFEIRRELGRGGFGVVFLAWDPKLAREVALKIPSADSIFSETLKRRFLREAQAAARLRHPNIVTVFETGEVGPTAYIAAEYHDGPNLAQWRRQRGPDEPLAARLAASLVGQLAEAVEHAHQRRVLHRDIKPSNVLLTNRSGGPLTDTIGPGDLVPKLTDFGLAKLADVEGDETRTGAVVGTPRYMSPEQAEGGKTVGPLSDVHALGVLLYELLTGRPPYVGETDIATLTAVCREEPIAPRRLRPNLPPELETVCLKCLQKQPEKRYESAGALAEDLRRYLAGEPILAKPATVRERLVKWTRRRPLGAALAGLSVLFFLTVLGISLWANSRQALANRAIEHERQRADDQAHITKANLYVADLVLAQQALDRGSVDEARSILEPFIESDPQRDLRTFEWYHLWHRLGEQSGPVESEEPELWWQSEDTNLETVALSPDGTLVAAEGTPGRIDLFEASSGEKRGSIAAHSAAIVDLAFSPDGTELYSVSDDTTIAISDPRALAVQERLRGHTDEAYAVAVAPAGKVFATGGLDCQLILWDRATLKPIWKNQAHADAVKCLAFSADGTRLASGSSDRTARVWEVATGRELANLTGHDQLIHGVALLPDDRVATVSYDRTLRIWDIVTGACVSNTRCEEQLSSVVLDPARSLVHAGSLAGPLRSVGYDGLPQALRVISKGMIADLALARDGSPLVVGYRKGVIEVLPGDRLLGQPPRTNLVGGGAYVAFLPNDRCALATYGGRGKSQILDLVSSSLTLGLHAPTRIGCMAVRPHTDEVALGFHATPITHDLGWLWWRNRQSGLPQTMPLWDRMALDMVQEKDYIESLAWTPDGASLAAGTSTGKVVVWDRERQQIAWVQQVYPVSVAVACSRDGKLVAAAAFERSEVSIWDRERGIEIASFDSGGHNRTCRFSPTQDLLLIGDRSGAISTWDTRTWSPLRSARTLTDRINALEFAPDGRYFAVGCGNGLLSLVSVDTLNSIWSYDDFHAPVDSVVFSPDGHWLGAGCRSNRCAFFDIRGFRCRDPFVVPDPCVPRGLSLAPDGRRLVTGADQGGFLVLDLPTQRIIHRGLSTPVLTHFLPDGKRIAAYTKDPPALLILDAQTFELQDEIRDDLPPSTLADFAVSADGRWAAVARNHERAIFVFDLAAKRRTHQLSATGSDVRAPAFSPDGRLLFGIHGNSRIECWNVPDFHSRWSTVTPTDSRVGNPVVSPDGTLVAASTNFGQHATIEILRGTDGERLFQLVDSELPEYHGLAFSHDGATLAAITNGDTIRCWNLRTRRPSIRLYMDAIAIEPAIQFLPEDRGLVVLGFRADRRGAVVKLFPSPPRQTGP